jgi:hypothetical protein
MRRTLPLAALGLALPFAAACDDPTDLTATRSVVSDTMLVYALSGTDFSFPAALLLFEPFGPTGRPVVLRPSGAFDFDIGFDIDEAGQVVLYPMSLLATNLAQLHPVGLVRVPGAFPDLARAPASGYIFDEPFVVAPGEVIAVQAAAPRHCGFPFPETIYAKLAVQSVDAARRQIRFALTVDPACGFRSFLPGIPTN